MPRSRSTASSGRPPRDALSTPPPCGGPSSASTGPEKKTLIASERDEAARQQWREVAQDFDVSTLIFVDESGTHRAMTPVDSRAPRGERAGGTVPRNRGQVTTLLASLSLTGMGAAMTIEGGTNQPVFEASINEVLVPTLTPGQTVIIDNCGAHQSDKAKEAIEAAQCRMLFLPAYSPDRSPIELAFSKIKGVVSRIGARTKRALEEGIGEALQTVTAEDARGWFAHCGYPPPAQPL